MTGMYEKICAWVIVPISGALIAIWLSGVELSVVESFVRAYQSLLLSIGTIFLISALGVWGTYLTNSSAERREKSNRRVQAELQIAQFRQGWIVEIRNDLSELMYLLGEKSAERNGARAKLLFSKVFMQINLEEELAEKLRQSFAKLAENCDGDEANNCFVDATRCSRAYLKAEWGRLKDDLKAAQLLEHD